MSDVVLNKIQIVQRCVHRARGELADGGEAFRGDFSRQDAAVMNVVRACEATIDLANLVVRRRRAGIPNTSAESFRLLARVGVLEENLADRLARMVGFRDVAVHAYQDLDLAIVESVIREGLDDVPRCCESLRQAVRWTSPASPGAEERTRGPDCGLAPLGPDHSLTSSGSDVRSTTSGPFWGGERG